MLQANYIHVKAAPEHTFPLLLKQTLVKQGCVVEDELFLQGNWKMGTCRPDTRSLLGERKKPRRRVVYYEHL